ncbi:Os01g0973200 [Oryza sativa Japonica Group]|uniref:Kinetochore protein SPC25 n=1 Tax=Oryza sativa subsp. japonica TaxID=39947 RepID=A0A0P0VDD4_ORYSJ|nr:Os01g0973200 [Oryza sativa Japonica Group]
MEGGGGGGGGAIELRRRMAAQCLAFERQIADGRERTKAAASAFSAALLSARSLSNHTISQREKSNQLKDQLRKLEADFAQALSIQGSNKTKYDLTGQSITNAIATNDQLSCLVTDKRASRDEYANVISSQLEAIEALEAKTDAAGKKNLDEAFMWYKKFLGFQVVGGEGVKFVFSKIDIQNPDNEYSFCIKLNKDRYNLLQCTPFLKDSEELVKDLNCSNDLFKFVRIMRERFQAAAINGFLPASSLCPDMSSSITDSSPPALSIDTGRESTTTTSQSHSRSRAKNQDNPTKRGARPSNLLSSTRRSPRVAVSALYHPLRHNFSWLLIFTWCLFCSQAADATNRY